MFHHHTTSTRSWILSLSISLVFLLSATVTAQAEVLYSIDFQGPTIGMPDSATTTPITAGDVLTPGTGTPAKVVFAGLGLGIVPSPMTLQPEVDALSFGFDQPIATVGNPPFVYSTDEFARGIFGTPGVPNVTSEGSVGNQQASADLYASWPLPPLPLLPGPPIGSTGMFDGDGLVPFIAPALTLIEPNPPTPGIVPDPGDNLDAVACTGLGFNRIYFSLDAAWNDPLEFGVANSGTAIANGFGPGDILVTTGTGPVVFAPTAALGLLPGDDIDALLLWENGNNVFDPSVGVFDWLTGFSDMVIFSLRRHSPTIGTPDAFSGTLIEEGDILTVTNGGGVPGILVPAERLGLLTRRTFGIVFPFPFGDDLNALSLPPC